MTSLDAAIVHAGNRTPVFPIHSIHGGRCSCGQGDCESPGKHPRTQHGLNEATTDPTRIREWWKRWQDANVAVRCDRLFILDVDPRHGGDRYLAELEAQHGTLPKTFRVRTGGGGFHYYFTAPTRSWRKQIAPGLDVQAGKGKYVLAPPSNHVSGGTYSVDVDANITVAPEWLIEAATRPATPPAPVGSTVQADALIEKRVRAYLGRCPPAVAGENGHAHTFTVCQQVVRGFALDAPVAYGFLSEWNQRCDPPWSEMDLRRKINEARQKGSRVEWGAHLRDRPTFASGSSSPLSSGPPIEREPGSDDDTPTPPRPALYGHDIVQFLGDEEDLDDDTGDWVIRGMVLRAAPNIIAGTPKSRKTMLALHMVISAAAGMPTWLERFPIMERCRVLVLSHEDSKRETRRRLWRLARGLGIDPRSLASNLRIADATEPFHFDHAQEMARMEATIQAWRPRIILMDSLSRMHVADENSKREMNAVTGAWLTLAARFDLSIVTIHHLVKTSLSSSLINQLRGSGDIGAAVRHAVGVSKNDKTPDMAHLWTDGNQPYQPDPFDVQIVDDVDQHGKPTIRIEITDSPMFRAAAEAILAVLRTGTQGAKQLRDACKGRGVFVDEVRDTLERRRLIRRLAQAGPWRLA